jgi:prepilin-type processing-associated H-X9-DG protein
MLMTPCHQVGRLSAFTRVELAAIIAVAIVLTALAVCAFADAKAKSRGICCNCRLKQIGLAFRIFGSDHGGAFPMAVSTNKGGSMEYASETFRHFQVLSNELSTPKLLACPADTRKPSPGFSALSDANISYFLGLEAKESAPHVLLAGDRNLMTNGVLVRSGLLELTTNLTVGWTTQMHKHAGNVAFGDGHVDSLSSNRLQEQLIHSGVAAHWLLIP